MSDLPIEVGGTLVRPGERADVRIPITRHYTAANASLPVHVIRGQAPGPTLFVSAALHGDEINGLEIVRRLLKSKRLRRISGTLLAVPVVNVFGLLEQSRNMPDRRDLNRSFPGGPQGSLASRLAHLFMKEIVGRSTHGIDLHTASAHRFNLPQVRAKLGSGDDSEQMARAFGAPVVLDAPLRPGSLRQAARRRGVPVIVYEGGEALRFDEVSIRAGVRGVLNVMTALGMLTPSKPKQDRQDRGEKRVKAKTTPIVANSSLWLRAGASGIVRPTVKLGARVEKGERVALITEPLGDTTTEVHAPCAGIVIGALRLPLVHEGDALLHIAQFDNTARASRRVKAFHEELGETDRFTPAIGPETT